MGAIKVLIMDRYLKRLRVMAKEYNIGMSDLMNEIAEWVLDQEDEFKKDLEKSLESGEEVEVSPEDIQDEEEDEDESESEDESEDEEEK